MNYTDVRTTQVSIYLAGDIADIRRACRNFCNGVGLCVTVTPTTFIYTGGAEEGAHIGLVNYPRFPSQPEDLMEKARLLAEILRKEAHQESVLVVGPMYTVWITTKEQG